MEQQDIERLAEALADRLRRRDADVEFAGVLADLELHDDRPPSRRADPRAAVEAALHRRVVGFLVIAVVLAGGCRSGGSEVREASPTPTPSISLLPTPTLIIHVPPIPDGVYETTITRNDARRLGLLLCDPQDVDENTGNVVMTLRNGRFRLVVSANHPILSPVNTGVYTGTRTVVTFISNPNAGGVGTTSARWRFHGKYLYFKVLKATDSEGRDLPLCIARLGWEAHPWLKTG